MGKGHPPVQIPGDSHRTGKRHQSRQQRVKSETVYQQGEDTGIDHKTDTANHAKRDKLPEFLSHLVDLLQSALDAKETRQWHWATTLPVSKQDF